MTEPRPAIVYKILTPAQVKEAEALPRWAGSPDDVRDGFIHLSAADQLAGTLARHFGGHGVLVLAAFTAAALGPRLRWEPSRGGALFPHLYGRLDLAAALWVRQLHSDAAGNPILPEEVR